MFYKILKCLCCSAVYSHAEYRLMSRRATESLLQYKEFNLFLRGIIPELGYNTSTVYYERKERVLGDTKYTFSKMLRLAIDGVTSFSMRPLYLIVILGIVLMLGGVGVGIWMLCIHGDVLLRFIAFCLCEFTGMLMCAIGLVGIYVGKTYIESKHRPRYFVMDRTEVSDDI